MNHAEMVTAIPACPPAPGAAILERRDGAGEPPARLELADWLARHPDTPPICFEALTGWVPAHGEVDLEAPRLLFRVGAWYLDLAEALRWAQGDWEAAPGGGFRRVAGDVTGRVFCWTVRGVGGAGASAWTLEIETAALARGSTTFWVPAAWADAPPDDAVGGAREQRVLARAFRSCRLRLGRALALLQHLAALGFESTQAYRDWCLTRGLAGSLDKGARARREEVEARAPEGAAGAGPSWFVEAVTRIHDGQAREADLRTEYLRRIARAFAGGLAGGARRALLDLLLHAAGCANLTGLEPAIPRLGRPPGNTWVEGLGQLARCHRSWLRPLAAWRPGVQDPRQQFGSLARHLLARYEVPSFMDAAWFRGRSAAGQAQRAWFLQLAGGQSIRTAEVPVALTKRMAHAFGQAPAQLSVEEALRWAQVVGEGGSEALFASVAATPLGSSFEHEGFWATVIRWLAHQPLLDPDWVGPIVDYIQHRKYEPREVVHPGGQVEVAAPPEPNLSMKSRSLPKLLDQIEAWHLQLAREAKAATAGWAKSAIADFTWQERDVEHGGALTWSIRELLSKEELASEGRELHHCAASYARSCRSGKTSVWSLQVTDGSGRSLRLATIALDPRSRALTQVRGRFNLLPNSQKARMKAGVDPLYALYLERAGRVLRSWVQREGLRRQCADLRAWTGWP